MVQAYGGRMADSSHPLSPRQARIVSLMETQVGPGPAQFFRDACTLLGEAPARASASHLIAHLLREVESAVRSVLQPPDARGADRGGGGHQAEIRAIMADLGFDPDDAVSEFWLGLAGQGNLAGLAARAHRSAMDAPRPIGQEFVEFFDRVEQIFDAVLVEFEVRYFRVFQRLGALLATAAPTVAHARRLRQEFPNNRAVSEKIFGTASASWVAAFQQAGFFVAPPPPDVDQETEAVGFASWPESQYLARVAADDPQRVVAAALQIPGTDNCRVGQDVVAIALAVPAVEAVPLVPKIVDVLERRFGLLLLEPVGRLLVHLCEGGRSDEALSVAAALLGREAVTSRSMADNFVTYEYDAILRTHLPPVVAACGVPALQLLAGTLDKVMQGEAQRLGVEHADDVSRLWRPNIDKGGRPGRSDIWHALIDAVIAASLNLVDRAPSRMPAVVDELESHEGLIFRRIALYVLSNRVDAAPDLVAKHLTDLVGGERGVETEYLRLAHSGAALLSAADLRRYLTAVQNGPQALFHPDEREPIRSRSAARWQRDRLFAIQPVLPPSWNARYLSLVAEFGEPTDPSIPRPETFAVWSASEPLSAGALESMSAQALTQYLQEWQARPGSDPGQSRASLRGALSLKVRGDAAALSSDAHLFIGLPVDFVIAAINGFWQAAADDAVLDWDGITDLSAWINDQVEQELVQATASDSRDWRIPRIDMLRLLSIALSKATVITPDRERLIWSIIDSCSRDRDPTPEREARSGPEEQGGYWSLSLNTVRSQAIRTAVGYGLRLRRASDRANLTDVEELLDRHLDHWMDPSGAVRSIYGELFVRLEWMDPQWARTRCALIFPTASEQRALLDSAWVGHVADGRVSDSTWPLLLDVYSTIVDRIEADADDSAHEFRTMGLGHRLLAGYLHGLIGVDSDDQLLRRFYAKASPENAMELMRSLGTQLQDNDPISVDLRDRLTAFWMFRSRAVADGADAHELTCFGHWFSSGLFDDAWSLSQLLVALSLGNDIEESDDVVSQLADLAPQHLQTCLAVLERWLRTEPQSWRLQTCLPNIRRILSLGHAGDDTAAATSQTITSLLLRDYGIDTLDVFPE
ncbi:hypothetical protein [Actinoplanes sp. NPDC049118]|uniref:hypothetical protein n=1 Tax=Actinoplanes sp. NPDC049118 TaxID=3155769 RepID=UPI0033DDE2DD